MLGTATHSYYRTSPWQVIGRNNFLERAEQKLREARREKEIEIGSGMNEDEWTEYVELQEEYILPDDATPKEKEKYGRKKNYVSVRIVTRVL